MGINWDNLGWGLAQWGNQFSRLAEQHRQRQKEEAVANTIGDMIKMQDYETGGQDQFKGEQLVGMPSMDLFEGGIPDPSDTTKIGDMTGYTPDHEGFVQDKFEKIMKNLQMTDPQAFVQLAPQVLQARESAMGKIDKEKALKAQYEYLLKTVADNNDLFTERFINAVEAIDPNDLASYAPTIKTLEASALDMLEQGSRGRADAIRISEEKFSKKGEKNYQKEKDRKLSYLREVAEIEEKIANRKEQRKEEIRTAKQKGDNYVKVITNEAKHVKEMYEDLLTHTQEAEEFQRKLASGMTDGDLNELLKHKFEVEPAHARTNAQTGEKFPGFEFGLYQLVSRLNEWNNKNPDTTDSKREWSPEEIKYVVNQLGEEIVGEEVSVSKDYINKFIMPVIDEVIKNPADLVTMQEFIGHTEAAKRALVKTAGAAVSLARSYPQVREKWYETVNGMEEGADQEELYIEGREMHDAYKYLMDELIIDKFVSKGVKSGKITINDQLTNDLPTGMTPSEFTDLILEEYGSGFFDNSYSYLTPDIGGAVPVSAGKQPEESKVDTFSGMLQDLGAGGEDNVSAEDVFEFDEPTQRDRFNTGRYRRTIEELEGLKPYYTSGLTTLLEDLNEEILNEKTATIEYETQDGQIVEAEIHRGDPRGYKAAVEHAIADHLHQVTGKWYSININRPPFKDVNKKALEWFNLLASPKPQAELNVRFGQPEEPSKDESGFISDINPGRFTVTGDE